MVALGATALSLSNEAQKSSLATMLELLICVNSLFPNRLTAPRPSLSLTTSASELDQMQHPYSIVLNATSVAPSVVSLFKTDRLTR